jgi:hypothetical protein
MMLNTGHKMRQREMLLRLFEWLIDWLINIWVRALMILMNLGVYLDCILQWFWLCYLRIFDYITIQWHNSDSQHKLTTKQVSLLETHLVCRQQEVPVHYQDMVTSLFQITVFGSQNFKAGTLLKLINESLITQGVYKLLEDFVTP